MNENSNSLILATVTGTMGGFGVTGGAHRFWCHRSYKAKLPLRIILMMCFTLAGQVSNIFLQNNIGKIAKTLENYQTFSRPPNDGVERPIS